MLAGQISSTLLAIDRHEPVIFDAAASSSAERADHLHRIRTDWFAETWAVLLDLSSSMGVIEKCLNSCLK